MEDEIVVGFHEQGDASYFDLLRTAVLGVQ